MIKIVECPRDAMQGIHQFIETNIKADYINCLLKVGFDTIDFGSFVSPKAIPQMKDTAQVLSKLDLEQSPSKLLVIIANVKGAKDALALDAIDYLGFPLSISETFQQRNTRKSIDQALEEVNEIQNLCLKAGKTLVVYLSMGFGNPYGDPYSHDMVAGFVHDLNQMQIKIISFADTIGVAGPDDIASLIKIHVQGYPKIEFGVHLHSQPLKIKEKIQAAFDAGCRRFDGALLGYGGCPMAEDELVGNVPTERLIEVLEEKGQVISINRTALGKAKEMAANVFMNR